ncbi:MAG: hypothetical protein CVV64_04170 [Candidatus Wallbacteria bacterium HGW-Wallbacteria-1]|jgi:tetratricopeptide (TPR) repeat protein|uniref:Uncharacterized protein n=1 Tax=Candidatus Wallbacteria bacterium HGW-Wallbacteria-1 TaxID=2013854 RepID=A0A2N1PRK5_9BACT|nr:MAG: hypothetical protein CVV64_04170 [Candidatus Wallbacteria bacterium HGW-Wallbacteria-1]
MINNEKTRYCNLFTLLTISIIAILTAPMIAINTCFADEAADLVFKGMDQYEKGEMEKAMASFTKSVDLGIDDPEVFFRMAHISEGNRNYTEAAKYYLVAADRAEKHEPDSPIHALSYSNLGAVLMKMGKSKAAEAAFSRAKKLSPANTMYLSNLATIFNSQGKHDQAIKCFNLLLLLEPENNSALMEKAATYSSMKEYSKALSILEKWPETDKNYNASRMIMARIFMMKGYFAKARELLKELEKKKYKNPDIYVNLGLISHLFDKSIPDAIAYYKKYYAMGGKNGEVSIMMKKLHSIWKEEAESINKR